ncbi:MAG TPA: putative porin [Planctomycetota bacterium]|nr:putative porin [Planctomycetota bacterium]
MRTLIAFCIAWPLLLCIAFADVLDVGEPRVYRVRQTVKLDQIPAGSKLVRWWVSVPDDAPNQQVLDFAVTAAPGPWKIEREPDRGNRFLYIEVANPDAAAMSAVVEFTVRREPVLIDVDPAKIGPITEALRSSMAEDLRRDAPHMQVTAEIQRIADEVCGSSANPAEQVEKLLEHVAANADHYSKDPSKPNCGVGDAGNCIAQGGGCCTDLHSLFIALARARGIPARLQMGYRLQEKNEGKEVDPGYRCWVEYFLPGAGWVPADIVEADAPKGLGPKRWFSGLTERRVWLNQGREFQLNPRQAGERVNTMSIGYAEIDGVAARVLPEGELKPQLSRSVGFLEMRPGDATNLTTLVGLHEGGSPPPASSASSPAAETLASPVQSPAQPQTSASSADSIFKRLSFYSDGRLRGESTYDQPSGEDRHRGRLRLRVGALYDVTEDVRLEARLSTAAPGSDANNPHWDFGDGADGFSGADIVLDRFYLNWKPCAWVDLRSGKFPHAFASPPVFGEFMWDADVHPAGVAGIWSHKGEGSGPSYDLRAVEYIAVENGSDSDPSMFGVQANLNLKASEQLALQLSTSYSHWSSLGAGATVLGNQGNTDVAGDFGIIEGFVAATYEGGPLQRHTAFVQAMHNADDEDDEDNGFAAGLQLGKSGKQGNANVFGVWYDLDANSVYSPVAQDDTPIPGTGIGTGMEGLIVGVQYFLTDNLSFKLWVLTSDADATEDPWRLRFDIDFRIR